MKIYFLNSNTLEIENHYFDKEYRDDIIIEIKGLYYEVYFFTKDALEYEMTKDGFFSFPNMIILEEITTEKIINSVTYLNHKGFFDRFKGEKELNQRRRFIHGWYANELSTFDESKMNEIELEDI